MYIVYTYVCMSTIEISDLKKCKSKKYNTKEDWNFLLSENKLFDSQHLLSMQCENEHKFIFHNICISRLWMHANHNHTWYHIDYIMAHFDRPHFTDFNVISHFQTFRKTISILQYIDSS